MNDESLQAYSIVRYTKHRYKEKKVEDLFDLSKKEIYTFNELKIQNTKILEKEVLN